MVSREQMMMPDCRLAVVARRLGVMGLALAFAAVILTFSTVMENAVLIKTVLAHILILALTLLWFAGMIENGRVRLEPAPFHPPLLALLAIGITSTLLTPFTYAAVVGLAHFLVGALAILLIYHLITDRRGVELLNGVIVLLVVLTSGYGILQLNNLDFINWGQRVYGTTFINPNMFAMFLAVTLPWTIGIIFSRRRVWVGILLLGVLGMGGYCLYRCTTRSAWYGLAVGLALWLLLQLLFGPGRWLGRWRYALAGGAVFVTVIMVIVMAGIALVTTIHAQEGTVVPSVREGMWIGGLKMLAEKPLLGQGIGTFQLTFPRHRPSYYHRWGISHNTRHAHSEPIQILAEQGLAGFIASLWLLAVLVISVIRTLHRNVHRYWGQLLIGLIAGIFAGLVDGLTSPHLRWTAPALTLAYAIGVVFALTRVAATEPEPENAPWSYETEPEPVSERWTHNRNPLRFIPYGGLLLAFAAVGYWEYRVAAGDYWLMQGEQAMNRAGAVVTSATKWHWEQAESAMGKAAWLNPWDHSPLYKLGYIHLMNGKFTEALACYTRITAMAPNYTQIHNNLGLARQNLSDTWGAVDEFAWASRLENNYRNQEHLGQLLMTDPSDDPRRGLAPFGRLDDLAFETWLVDLRRQLYYISHKSPQATEIESAIERDRVDASRGLILRGNGWQDLGDQHRARYYFNRARTWKPTDAEAWYGLAVAAEQAGETAAALEAYDRVLAGVTREQVNRDDHLQRVLGLTINALQPRLQRDIANARMWDRFGWAWYLYGGRTDEERVTALDQAGRYCAQAQTIVPDLPGNREHLAAIAAAREGRQ